jgi:hypothetical protein
MSASDADGAQQQALTPKPSPLGGGGGLRELLSDASPLQTTTSASPLAPNATTRGSLASSQQQHQHRHRLSSLMDSDGEIAR